MNKVATKPILKVFLSIYTTFVKIKNHKKNMAILINKKMFS